TSARMAPSLSSANSELGDAHDAALAGLLQEDPKRRPADAFEARKIVTSLTWPTELRAPLRSERPRVSERPAASEGRLGPAFDVGDGRDAEHRQRDTWLER